MSLKRLSAALFLFVLGSIFLNNIQKETPQTRLYDKQMICNREHTNWLIKFLLAQQDYVYVEVVE